MSIDAQQHPELIGLLPRDRAEVLRRARMVHEIEAMLCKGRSQGFKAHDLIDAYSEMLKSRGVAASNKSLWNWRRQYRLDGLKGLIDRRKISFRPPLSRVCPRFLGEIEFHVIFGEGSMRSRIACAFQKAKHAAEVQGWRICTFREAVRWLRSKAVTSPEAFDARNGKAVAAIKRRSQLSTPRPRKPARRRLRGDRTGFNAGLIDI